MRDERAVSLIEIIVVLVALAVVAALAIPRFTQAGETPDARSVLRQHLRVLRVAIERYHQDHGVYPGVAPTRLHPGGSSAALIDQLTLYSDAEGHVSDVPSFAHRFGPYLRDGIPPCPLPPCAGMTGVRAISGDELMFDAETPGAGWLYDPHTGQIAVNTDAVDESGRSYISY